jgi:ESX secretion system ATPase EccB
MPSRREQLQSHQFLTQRVVSAFVTRETDPAQSPLRRGIGAVFAGVMIAVMVAAGFGVYGLLTKVGGTSWQTDGAVVIETDTGASYVYQGGRLHPMLNYTSALLATGTPGHPVFKESASALRSVPRGVLLGIPYAPDSLPDAGHLAAGSWSVCTRTPGASADPVTTLALATPPAGATPIGDRGLLVRDPQTSTIYLIWHGSRYHVAPSLLSGLFGVVTPLPVGTAFLNGIPRGPDIAPLSIPAGGAKSAAAPKYTVGQLLANQVGSSGQQFWMVFDDGLAPITELQKDIAVSQGAAKPAPISVPDTNAIRRSNQLRSRDQIALPAAPPDLATPADPAAQMCASFPGGPAGATVTTGGVPMSGTATPAHSSTGAVLADQILVPPGRAELVRVLMSSGSASAGYYLVTDLGIRYAISNDDVLNLLGFTADMAVPEPDTLVRLIPAGPTLDPAAAVLPATLSIDGS